MDTDRGFAVGDALSIHDPLTGMRETNTLRGFGSMLLGKPLRDSYGPGTEVTKVVSRRIGLRMDDDGAVKRALDAMVRLLDQQHAGSVPEAVRKVLDRLDRNGDGRLSYSEVQSGLLDLGLRPVSSDVEAVMRALDSNGSGYVDYMELYTALTKHDNERAPLSHEKERAMRVRLGPRDGTVKRALDAMVRLLDQQHAGSVPEAVRKVLDRLDRNGDGRLSYSEVQSGLLDLGLRPVSSDVEAVMRALDSDGSGYVDYRELYTALTKHTLAPSALEDAAPRALLRSAARCTAAELLCQHRCMPWFGACVSRHGMCVCFDTGPATHGSMWTRTAGLRSAMRSRSMTR